MGKQAVEEDGLELRVGFGADAILEDGIKAFGSPLDAGWMGTTDDMVAIFDVVRAYWTFS